LLLLSPLLLLTCCCCPSVVIDLLSLPGLVVQAGKDMTYIFVILGGFAIAGFLLWNIGSEFFRSDSPSTIFTRALKRVKSDPRVRNFNSYFNEFMLLDLVVGIFHVFINPGYRSSGAAYHGPWGANRQGPEETHNVRGFSKLQ